MDKVVVVTGGSSGIGRATVAQLREKGCRVYEFSRRESADPMHFSVDVTDAAAVKAAVDAVAAKEGRLDVLINNAGFGISGAMEFTDPADAHRLMEVNLFGMDNAIRAVLPHMRKAGAGRIVNIGSVAQRWPWNNKVDMALYNEVAPFGIDVACVMPGDIRTGFTAARKKSAAGDAEYGGRVSASVAKMERDEQNGMRPEDAAKTIVRVALKAGRVKPCYAIGFTYKCLVLLDSLLPCRAVRWLLFQLYGK